MDDTVTRDDSLQFDTVAPVAGQEAVSTPASGVTCIGCGQAITDSYYDINGNSTCATCRALVERNAAEARRWGVFFRALAMGLGAAVLGAVLYYAVIAITNYEIGIVAIAIGYMVGYAIRRGARGAGGRRFQVAAVLLTYWAVGLAYTPLAFREMAGAQDPAVQEATADRAMPSSSAGAPATTGQRPDGSGTTGAPTAQFSVVVALLVVSAMTLVLPVLSVIGSMPGGLLSALIIGVGMRQAWQMTAAPLLQITGPLRIARPVQSA